MTKNPADDMEDVIEFFLALDQMEKLKTEEMLKRFHYIMYRWWRYDAINGPDENTKESLKELWETVMQYFEIGKESAAPVKKDEQGKGNKDGPKDTG